MGALFQTFPRNLRVVEIRCGITRVKWGELDALLGNPERFHYLERVTVDALVNNADYIMTTPTSPVSHSRLSLLRLMPNLELSGMLQLSIVYENFYW
jgi:hypothetical protein